MFYDSKFNILHIYFHYVAVLHALDSNGKYHNVNRDRSWPSHNNSNRYKAVFCTPASINKG